MAIPLFADRVKETSTTTGTGTLDLDGASTGFLTLVQGIGDTKQCYYVISDGTQFEIGIGTVTAAATDTLSRDTILQTSNNDTTAISWGAGTRDVFVTLPASQVILQERLKPYSGRNALINGDFRIAQRGTSWSSIGNIYNLDRWLIAPGGGSVEVDVDRLAFTLGQTAVPGEPQYYISLDRRVDGSSTTIFSQRIEGVRTLAGQEVTLSYYAQVSSSIADGDVVVQALQYFGSGGSASGDVTTNFSNPLITTAW